MRKSLSAIVAAALVAAGALAVPASASAAAVPAAKSTTATCANIILLGVAGSGERTPAQIKSHNGFGSTIKNLLTQIETDLKASSYRAKTVTTFRKETLDYPAAAVPTTVNAQTVKSYVKSADQGVTALRNRITKLRTTCPSSKVVIAGYSQGAWVTHAALASFGSNKDAVKNVKATILLADPNNNTSVMYGNLINNEGKHVWESQWNKIKGLGTVADGALSTLSSTNPVTKKFWQEYVKNVRQIERLRPGKYSDLLKDPNRTVSVCSNRDPLCSFGSRTLPGIASWTAHTDTYKKSAVSQLLSAYVVPRVMPSAGNGVCDPGELCAYANKSKSGLVLDSNKIGGTQIVTGFKRDTISSVWNRSMYRWSAVNKRTGLPDERLVMEPLQYRADLTTVKWNDKIDHFDVLKD